MTEEIMKLQICNGAMQVTKDSIKYLAEKLQDATDAAEPSIDELKLCYYDAENIGSLLLDCVDKIAEGLDKSEELLQSLRSRKSADFREIKKKG